MCRFLKLLFSCAVELIFSAGFAAGQVDSVILGSMGNVKTIGSFEFEVTEEVSMPKSSAIEASRHRFRQSGDLTRSDLFMSNVGDPVMIFAYDGVRFQNFDLGMDALSFSSSNRFPTPYGLPCPMLLPYRWLGEVSNWSELKDISLWTDAIGVSMQVSAKSIGEEVCDEILMEFPTGHSYKVAFSRSKNHLPIAIEGRYKDESFSIHINKTEEFQFQGGNAFLPVEIAVVDGKTIRNYFFTNFKINHRISEDNFTLSHSIAKNIDDYDRNMEEMVRKGLIPDLNRTERAEPRSRFLTLGLIIITAAILVGMYSLGRSGKR